MTLLVPDVSEVEANSSQGSATQRGIKKRIIVCCDGTWQDGFTDGQKGSYSNITRIARAIDKFDMRQDPPIPQIVFYQSGIGSVKNWYSQDVEGVLGSTLGSKIEEAYAFIAQNYCSGDEIFLFGFSRGAYTARMVAMFIGAIGILDSTEQEFFPSILMAYQKSAKSSDSKKIEEQEEVLKRFSGPNSPSRVRCTSSDKGFSIKCIGVFETVGEQGLPMEINLFDLIKPPPTVHQVLGFPDNVLGTYVERAYQAFGINEDRRDFTPVKFERTPEGKEKGQILHQCWFTGIHDDIGGGYEVHDLSDITLCWMVSNVEDILSINVDYILSTRRPSAPWGQAVHHNLSGIWKLEFRKKRQVPTHTDDVTCESVHESVLQQKAHLDENKSGKELMENLVANRETVIKPLMSFEEVSRTTWPYKAGEGGNHGM